MDSDQRRFGGRCQGEKLKRMINVARKKTTLRLPETINGSRRLFQPTAYEIFPIERMASALQQKKYPIIGLLCAAARNIGTVQYSGTGIVYRIMPKKRTLRSQNFPLTISIALSLKRTLPGSHAWPASIIYSKFHFGTGTESISFH